MSCLNWLLNSQKRKIKRLCSVLFILRSSYPCINSSLNLYAVTSILSKTFIRLPPNRRAEHVVNDRVTNPVTLVVSFYFGTVLRTFLYPFFNWECEDTGFFYSAKNMLSFFNLFWCTVSILQKSFPLQEESKDKRLIPAVQAFSIKTTGIIARVTSPPVSCPALSNLQKELHYFQMRKQRYNRLFSLQSLYLQKGSKELLRLSVITSVTYRPLQNQKPLTLLCEGSD